MPIVEAVAGRLREIEAAARAARLDAEERLRDLGLALDRCSDMRLIAGLLTGGVAELRPNLADENGERLAGSLEWLGDTPQLLVEAHHPLVRRRFSWGHELGHYYLRPNTRPARRRCSPRTVDPEPEPEAAAAAVLDGEVEADSFAGAFLVPAAHLVTDLARFGRCAAFLAERYQVSEATIRRRLRVLEYVVP